MRNYTGYSGLVVGLMAFWARAWWGFSFVMAKDYDRDKVSVNGRLAKIEMALGALSTGQMESQELQLQARVQGLERELV